MLKTLFYYCYYRIAQAYRSFNDWDFLDWGYYILYTSFMFISYSLAVPISYVLNRELTKTAFVLMAIPFILLYVRTFFISEKRKMELFNKLEKRYKNEPHRKRNGWLVAMFVLGTFVLFNLMCILFVLK